MRVDKTIIPRSVVSVARPRPANGPLALHRIRLNDHGKCSIQVKGREFYLSAAPQNKYARELKAGNLLYLVYEDRVVFGVWKNQHKSNGYDIEENFRTIAPSVYMDHIETVRFSSASRVSVGIRRYTGRRFSLAKISPNYGEFEDRGQVDNAGTRITYRFLDVYFRLDPRIDNDLTRTALAGCLLMKASVFAEAIEFLDTRTRTVLHRIPIERRKIKNPSGGWIRLYRTGTYNLSAFWPEIAKPKEGPRVVSIAKGKTEITDRGVNYRLHKDAWLKHSIMQHGGVLLFHQDRVEFLLNTGAKFTIYLDKEGYVLGTDGKRFVSVKSGKTVRIPGDQEEAYEPQSLPLAAVALKNDPSVLKVAKEVEIDALGELIGQGKFDHGEIYCSRASLNGEDRINIQIRGETVPLTASALLEAYRHREVYLAAKKINNRIHLSVHGVESKFCSVDLVYLSHLNRFGFYREDKSSGYELCVVEAVDKTAELKRFGGNYYYSGFMRNGSIVYVAYNGDEIPNLRRKNFVLFERNEIVDRDGNMSYVYGHARGTSVLRKFCGWVCGLPLFISSKEQISFAIDGGQTTIPARIVSALGLRKGDTVDAYAEYGVPTAIKVHGRTVNLPTLRDRDLKLQYSGGNLSTRGILAEGPSFIENANPLVNGGYLGIKAGQFIRLFAFVKGSRYIRARFFAGKRCSVVCQPDGQVLYWTDRAKFSPQDLEIIDDILSGKVKNEEAARILEARAELVMAQAFRRRKMQIYDDLYEQLAKLSLSTEAAVARASRYLTDEKLTALEIAYALKIIWDAANFKYLGHAVKFQALWADIYQVLEEIPTRKLFSAFWKLWYGKDQSFRPVLRYLVKRAPDQYEKMISEVLAINLQFALKITEAY